MIKNNSLSIDSLSFSYGKQRILSGIYLKLQTADITGLLGRNGCGKSTFIQCLLKIKRNRGILKLNHALIAEYKIWKHCVYLPQASFLPKDIKVLNAIKLFLQDNYKINQCLKDRRISLIGNQRVSGLSGGERRYLELMLVLSTGRPFIFLDEPFTEIDPKYVATLTEQIIEQSKSAAFLITDHNHRAVRRVATRLLVMSDMNISEIAGTDRELRTHGYFPDRSS